MYAWQTTWQDYYATLEVGRKASTDEIHRAWRRLSMANGVDRLPADVDAAIRDFATSRQKEINAAKDALARPGEKSDYDREYDRRLKAAPPGAKSGSPTPGDPTSGAAYHPILEIADSETTFTLKGREGEEVSFIFTVRHKSGNLPPAWQPAVKFKGAFLDTARIQVKPKNRFPMAVSVTIPCQEVGTSTGFLEFFVVPVVK
jgi:curved DNA-binding protein CbpA